MSREREKKTSLWELRKELRELDSTDELLADFLLSADEWELYELLRRVLIVQRMRVAASGISGDDSPSPEAKAMEILYALIRFVQQYHRFPNRKEQALLLSGSSGIDLADMSSLLQEQDSSPKSRTTRKRQRQSSLRNTVGVDQ